MDKNLIIKKSLASLNQGLSDFTVKSLRLIESSDGLIVLADDAENHYSVLVQAWAPQQAFEAIQARVKELKSRSNKMKVIVLADFINPIMAEKLKNAFILFADCSGNIFFRENRKELFVKRKKDLRNNNKRSRGRAFNSAGLKLIFAFFNTPAVLNKPYRSIAEDVGVALGSIGPTIDDLVVSGYMTEHDGFRKIINKKRLFERWVDAYLEKLRPGLLLGRFRSDKNDWWKNVDENNYVIQWGGEITVAKKTPFLLPENTTVYCTEDELDHFVRDASLEFDEEGDVEIFDAFWLHRMASEEASKMIVYADLIDTVDPAAWDGAKIFYAEAIEGLLTD